MKKNLKKTIKKEIDGIFESAGKQDDIYNLSSNITKELVEKMIPDLKKLRLPQEKKVKVEVFEGKEGFRNALNRTIEDAKKGDKEILMLNALADILQEIDPIYQAKYYLMKKKEKIHTKYIFNIKQFFRHFVEGHNPFKLQRTSNLSKYKIGTTSLALPFRIKLHNSAYVEKQLESFRDQGLNVAQILAQSAMNNWSDLYEPKG
jgi:hypothetical protein